MVAGNKFIILGCVSLTITTHSTWSDTSVMLPILRDDSKSPATTKHLLNVLIQSIHQLNPKQTAVIGFDQPLYALTKKIE